MSIDRNPAGLILSAGFSSRMKDFKPLMKIGGKTPLEILIDNLRTAGVDDIYVVVGYNAEILTEYLSDKGVHVVENENFEQGMFTSIQKGVEAAAAGGHDCFLMTPVDIPLVPPYIMKAVMNRYYRWMEKNTSVNGVGANVSAVGGASRGVDGAEPSGPPFVVPCFEGKKGHPLLIPAAYAEEILASDGENGLKSVTSLYEDRFIRVDTHCRGIILDMDTQEAYRQLVDYYEQARYPDEEQCFRIIERMETPGHVIKHCIAVTNTAVAVTEALNEHGGRFSVPLVRAAGLLHDVLRVKKAHWEAGAKCALDYGYPEVADIIMDHMHYVPKVPVHEITEKDIICLSDKLRQEDRLVTLEDRLAPVKIRWADDPEVLEIVEHKIQAAGAVMKFIEDRIGRDIHSLSEEYDARKREESEEPESPRRRIILIRHGETQRHKEKIFLGQTDVPLNEEGKDQCTIVGIEMQHFNVDTDVIYCSDLKRAKDSAKIIAGIMGDRYQIQPVPEFREMNLGRWDGMYIREVKTRYPEEYARRGEDMIRFKIDETAESFVELRERVVPKFNEILSSTKGDIVIVSHSGVLLTLKCEIMGRSLEDIRKMKFRRGTYEFLEIGEGYLQRHHIAADD